MVEGKEVASIGPGLVAFVGVARGDSEAESHTMAEKLGELRLFPDKQGKLARSLLEMDGELLLVPNFTVMGDCAKGRRPSFDKAAPAEQGRGLFEQVVARARALGLRVAAGPFGAFMDVEVVNQGPVTVIVEKGGAGA